MKPAARPRPVRSLALSLAVAALASACSLLVTGTAAALPGAPAANPDAPAVSAGPVRRADVAGYLAEVGRRLAAAPLERAEPAGAGAVTAAPEYDEVGGDDVLAAIEDSIRAIAAPSMDIANNGDIFVAVQVEVPNDYEIHVYRSQDGGRTWQLWGSLADPATDSQFHEPSLCVAEGSVDRLFVAYRHDRPAATASIDVAYADPSLPAAAFTTRTVMDSTNVSFGHPSIRSDEEASSGYYVYVAAQGGGPDFQGIWIARSRFQGDPWEDIYCIASLPATSQRLYIEPQITYGNDCQVHCVWRFLALDGSADQAIRYRRATNCAGFGIDDWEPVVYLTPNNNGLHEAVASVAASHVTTTALVSYSVRTLTGTHQGTSVRASYDAGVTWDPADVAALGDDTRSHHLLALPGGAGFIHFGAQGTTDNLGYEKAADVVPVTWSPHLSFMDRDYDHDLAFNAASIGASDPTRADQVAIVWYRHIEHGGSDSLYFDAEWRGGPGFPNLEPGFPMALSAGVRSPLGICELDGDSESELVFGDNDGNVQVRNHDGTSLPGWPIDIGDIAPDGPVAVGDLDGDGVNEVVCGNTAGIVHAFRPDGSPFPGWPVDTGYPDSVYVSIGAVTAGSHRQVVACVDNRLFLLSAAGVVPAPFPMKTGGPIRCSAAIGDMDGNGYGDIVILQHQYMNVINGNGTVLGFRNFIALGKSFSNSPTLADLDGDGDLEIAAPTDQGDLYVLHPDGTDYPGFPFTDPLGRPLSSVAMAQIRGTASPELVYAVDDATAPQVRALYSTGATLSGFPAATGTGWRLLAQPILDVLDGGSPDVAVGSRDSQAHAWDNFGEPLPGWPAGLGAKFHTSPASGDIDSDGRVEVALVSWDSPRLVVMDLGAPVVRGGSRRNWYWPMYGYNPERQGCLDCGEDAVLSVPEAPGPAGGVRFAPPMPNPSGGPVALAFELPARAAVTLTVYDVAGRRLRELVRSELSAGRHSLTWDGRDEAGAGAPAGVYYARLVVGAPAGGEPVVRKITLLR